MNDQGDQRGPSYEIMNEEHNDTISTRSMLQLYQKESACTSSLSFGQLRKQDLAKPEHFMVWECCCGCSLRTACLSVGWISVIIGVAVLMLYVGLSFNPYAHTVVLAVTSVSGLLSIAYGLLVLFGVYLEHPRTLCVAYVIFLILTIVDLIMTITLTFMSSVAFLACLVYIPFALYMCIVIRSYSIVLQQDKEKYPFCHRFP